MRSGYEPRSNRGLAAAIGSIKTGRAMKPIHRALSLALLIAALLVFGAFHFLPGFETENKGWNAWVDLWHLMSSPEELAEPLLAVAVASFLTFTLLIAASPFLGNVWLKSRFAWWLAVIFSGLAAAGFWIGVFGDGGLDPNPGPGGWCLLTAPMLNFAGLLMARRNGLRPDSPPETTR